MSQVICAICLDRLVGLRDEFLEIMPAVAMTGCGHTFHKTCLVKALKAARKRQLRAARGYADVDEWDSEDFDDYDVELPACPTCKQVRRTEYDDFYDIENSFVTLFFSEEGKGDPVASVSARMPINEDAKKQLALAHLAQTYGIALDELTLSFKRDHSYFEEEQYGRAFADALGAHDVRQSMLLKEVQITKLLQDVVKEKSDQVLKSMVAGVGSSLTSLKVELNLVQWLMTKQAAIERLNAENRALRNPPSPTLEETLKAAYDAEVQAIKAAHAVEIAILSDTHSKETSKISEEHNSEMRDQAKKLQDQIDVLRKAKEGLELDHELETKARIDSEQQGLKWLKSEVAMRIKLENAQRDHKRETAELKNQSKEDLAKVQKKYEARKLKNKKLQAEVGRLKSLDVKNDALSAENNLLKKQFQDLKTKINAVPCSIDDSDSAPATDGNDDEDTNRSSHDAATSSISVGDISRSQVRITNLPILDGRLLQFARAQDASSTSPGIGLSYEEERYYSGQRKRKVDDKEAVGGSESDKDSINLSSAGFRKRSRTYRHLGDTLGSDPVDHGATSPVNAVSVDSSPVSNVSSDSFMTGSMPSSGFDKASYAPPNPLQSSRNQVQRTYARTNAK